MEARTRSDLVDALNAITSRGSETTVFALDSKGEDMEQLADGALSDSARQSHHRMADDGHGEGHGDPGMTWTRKFGGGVVADFRRRWPHYVADYKDGFRTRKVWSAIGLMYIATLAPCLAFGGLLQELTNGQIGVVETMLSQTVTGILFAVLGGSPMMILRPTGPIVVITEATYIMSVSINAPFFAFMGTAYLWTALLLILVAVSDLSVLMKHCTPFTEEVFEGIVAGIFISKGINHLAHYGSAMKNTSLAAHILWTLTFVFCFLLWKVESTPYMRAPVRRIISDFSSAIGIAVCSIAAMIWFRDDNLPMLDTPVVLLNPTNDTRPWWVFSEPGLTTFHVGYSFLPGLCMALLFFVEQNIVGLVVNAKTSATKNYRGSAYHWDMLIVGLLTIICSLFGLALAHPSLPHSPMHVDALSVSESYFDNDGTPRTRILKVKENRISALAVNVMIGFTIFALPLLRIVPLPVIYGFFFYLGIRAALSNPFIQRVRLLLVEPRLFPPTHFARVLKPLTIHAYTIVQVGAWLAIWYAKKYVALVFPVVVLVLLPFRKYVVPLFFNKVTLDVMDPHDH